MTTADFESFVHGCQPGLLRFGTMLTGNPHDSADLVQAALERVLRKWQRVSGLAEPTAYAKKCMVNLHVSNWRRLRREVLTPRAGDERMADVPTASPMSTVVWQVVTALPARQRATLVLRYYEDLSETEIADVLGCSVGTVKSQASRAVAKVRTALETEMEWADANDR